MLYIESKIKLYLFCFVLISALTLPADESVKPDMVVAQDSSGDFQSIQQAIDQIPVKNRQRIVIYIRPGLYKEKIFLDRDGVSLIGENPDNTIIECAILRRIWVGQHDDDWGAAVVNLKGNDLILKNLTVRNPYGDLFGDHDHQFAVRLQTGTRIIFDNCRFLSGGGDTVSLWDKERGMYYHRNCYFAGYVDFVCPRGWCYITNSEFFEKKATASLWHDGEKDSTQKLVIKNSSFDGVPGFKLGRRHYDASFYLIDCRFSKRMAAAPIYRVTYPDDPGRDRLNLWKDRNYFYNCLQESGNYGWLKNNLPDALSVSEITPAWTFNERWNPEDSTSITPASIYLEEGRIKLTFSEEVVVKGRPRLLFDDGEKSAYFAGSGTREIFFSATEGMMEDCFPVDIIDGILIGFRATLAERIVTLKGMP